MNATTESALMSGIFNSIPNPIFALDEMQCIVLANRAFCDLISASPDKVRGISLGKVLPPAESALFSGDMEQANNCEIAFLVAGGQVRPFQVSVLKSSFGKKALWVITLKDQSEYKRNEASLRESEMRYRTLVNQLPNPIVIHIDRKVVFANDLILAITGTDQEKIIGMDVAELLSDPADPGHHAIFRNLSGDEFVEEEEFEIRTANRKVVIKNFLLRNSRIKYMGQDAVMTIMTDITGRKHLEKYILSRVMETEEKDRKQFAADLHDDLGPILSSIKLHLGLLEHSKSPEKHAEILSICNQQLAETISKMRFIANNLMPRLIENFGLEAAVNAFAGTMQHEGTFSIHVISNLQGRRFQMQTELHVYRIICELINNTVKHACATAATLKLRFSGGVLTMRYTDNGKGYEVADFSQHTGGMGIGNIVRRAGLIDAKIRFVNRKKKTEVILTKEIL